VGNGQLMSFTTIFINLLFLLESFNYSHDKYHFTGMGGGFKEEEEEEFDSGNKTITIIEQVTD
jgi:hypothetical protein